MSVEKNITMRQFNGTDYDTLYPKTDVKQIENLTPSSIGAVSKSGDTMTGILRLANTGSSPNAAEIIEWTDGLHIREKKDDNNYADIHLALYNLRFGGVNGGNSFSNIILHDGNAQTLGFPKIAIGSYVGTGTYYSNNPNSLTFDFEPKVVIVVADGPNGLCAGFLIVRGQTYSNGIGSFSASSVALDLHITWSGTTVSWYTTNDFDAGKANAQMNTSGTTFRYVALG